MTENSKPTTNVNVNVNVSELRSMLNITRQTLCCHVTPEGQLRPDESKLMEQSCPAKNQTLFEENSRA